MAQLVADHVLSSQEVTDIQNLLEAIFVGAESIAVEPFLLEARLFAQELPRSVRRAFYDYALRETSVALRVRSYPIDDRKIGPTPQALPSDERAATVTREDALHVLFASLLGEPIAWTTQQRGRVLNDIIPIKENEDKLISSGSSHLFDLHTEDAFHPYAADYLGLMGLRNPGRVPTIIASLEGVELDPDVKYVLFEPRFFVGANLAHTVAQPEDRVPVFFGSYDAPYMRVNLNLQSALEGDTEAQHALDTLSEALTSTIMDVALEPGDFFYLDNFRAAHGRRPYTAKYDGSDRWLKRLTITSYLRKSRDLRECPESRVIKPAGVL